MRGWGRAVATFPVQSITTCVPAAGSQPDEPGSGTFQRSTKPRKMAWTRSDKIAACSMIVALIALVYPIAQDINEYVTAPSATINVTGTYIFRDDSGNIQVYTDGIGLVGNASNIPGDRDLWLIVRPQTKGAWQPITRLHPAAPGGSHGLGEGKWLLEEGLVLPERGSYGIFVYLVTSASSAELQQWQSRQAGNPHPELMPSLPADMNLLAFTNIARVQ